MGRETVYTPKITSMKSAETFTGCLVIHPTRGTGLITGMEDAGQKWDRTEVLFHVLWGGSSVPIHELVPWSTLLTCRIVRPDEETVALGSWDSVTGRT